MKKQLKKFLVVILQSFARILVVCLKRWNWKDLESFYNIFQQHGFYLLPKHYYLPIPDDDDMTFTCESELIGINMNDELQIQFTYNVVLHYRAEFEAFPHYETHNPHQYFLVNGSFMAGDGHAYYALIRHLKPTRIIEIGSGYSTVLASHAIKRNVEECPNHACTLLAIEPYPAEYLKTLAQVTELKVCKLQEIDLSEFEQLHSGDIIFIDSSHVLKSGGDVWLEYCEIIPRLHPGVYIHFHDISLPKPYPRVYYDAHSYWNEQYVLQTLLTHNTTLEVVWAGTYLFHKFSQEMITAFSPGYDIMRRTYPQAEPSSFWIRVK